MSRTGIVSILLSGLLHGGALLVLSALDSSPPGTPPLAGGRGSGELEVGIHLEGPVELPLEPAVGARVPAELPETARADVPALPDPGKPEEILPTPVLFAPHPPEPMPVPPAIAPDQEVPDAAGPRPMAAAAPPAPPPEVVPHPLPGPPLPREDAGGGGPVGPGTEAPAIGDPGSLRPVYPLSCRRAGHEGTAVVRVHIGVNGEPLRVELVKGAGCPDLDRAALEAAAKARFRPARAFGRPIASSVDQPIRFELRKPARR